MIGAVPQTNHNMIDVTEDSTSGAQNSEGSVGLGSKRLPNRQENQNSGMAKAETAETAKHSHF